MGVVLEDRSYKLGDTIRLQVALTAKRDCQVSEGRVDLVCEERYSENFATVVPDIAALKARSVDLSRAFPSPNVSQRETREHTDTYVHSSAVFLKGWRLRARLKRVYYVKLSIRLEPPPHAGETDWWIETVVDAGGRKYKTREQVRMSLG